MRIPMTIDTEKDLEAGVTWLAEKELRFSAIHKQVGLPPLRRSKANFETLVHIIVEQMISFHAANAISGRLRATVVPFVPETVCEMDLEKLRSIGLSEAKARAVKAVAAAISLGELDLENLSASNDDSAKTSLTAVRGIGPWTAEIYILTALGRSDAWPAGDVALQIATQDIFALSSRPDSRAMLAIAEPWRPWRAAAARLLWSHYRHRRGLTQKLAL